jgi:hypothetical protein
MDAYIKAKTLVCDLEEQLKKHEHLLDENKVEQYGEIAAQIGYYDALLALYRAKRAYTIDDSSLC